MFSLRSLGYVGEGVRRGISWGGGLVSCGAVQPGAPLVPGRARAFLGHSHPSLWRGRFTFSLQTAVDVCWLPPRSHTAMHLHSQHRVVFVLKD